MLKGEPSELLVAKGYWKAIRDKLLRVVDETFCSIPTDDANCCYLDRPTSRASTTQCKPEKNKGSNDRSSHSWNCIFFPREESFYFILKFLLDYRKDNLVILVINSLFPYQRLILSY